MYLVCSDRLPREMDAGEPSESVVSDDTRRASDILQFTHESTPPPKSDDVPDVNGSSKQSKKSKRPQWFSVRTLQSLCFHCHRCV